MKRIVLGIFLMLTSSAFAQINCPPQLPADICEFETKVYTDTNFKSTPELKEVLVNFKSLLMKHSKDSALIQDHLLTVGGHIVEEAYNQRAPKQILALADGQRNLLDMLKNLRDWEAKNGQIVPLDWRLPDGFTIGVTSFDRSYDVATDRLRFAISFFSVLDRPLFVEQFKITRYGGDVIIDKTAGIGDWNEGQMNGPARPYVSASSTYQDTPMPDGLYLLSVKVKDQKQVEGWFFLHGTATASPVIYTPQVNEKFSTANPTFQFQDFTSGSLLKSDGRKLTVKVFSEGTRKQVWDSAYINPRALTSVTLGHDRNQSGDRSLNVGSYRLKLAFEERSYFGDLTIGRQINTTVPFAIAR